jgi:hypothetical protein
MEGRTYSPVVRAYLFGWVMWIGAVSRSAWRYPSGSLVRFILVGLLAPAALLALIVTLSRRLQDSDCRRN